MNDSEESEEGRSVDFSDVKTVSMVELPEVRSVELVKDD